MGNKNNEWKNFKNGSLKYSLFEVHEKFDAFQACDIFMHINVIV